MFGIKKYDVNKKSKILGIIFCILFLFLSIRLFIIQKKYGINMANNSMGNNIQKENIAELNYLLLDKDGDSLWGFDQKYKIVIDCKAFRLNNTDQNLQNIIAFNYIMKEEDRNFSFDEIIKIKGKKYYDVSKDTYDKVSKLEDIRGVYYYEYSEQEKQEAWKIENILTNVKAFNPYSNEDNTSKGEASLEMYIKKELDKNDDFKKVFEKDLDGKYSEGEIEVNKENLNVKLTLDKELQEKIRVILNDEKYNEYKNIGAVLIEGDTGKILSLAQKDESQANIVIGSGGINGYEPGSIFKILTLEAAMEYHNIKLKDKFNCSGMICSEEKVHGQITVEEAFKVSCNDVFALLGAQVTESELIEFAKKQGLFSVVLGLDKKTGMEAKGLLPEKEAGVGLLSVGQSIQATLIQMAGIISPIINEGMYIKPYLVDSFENIEGETVKKAKTVNEKVISSHVADSMKYIMNRTVANGTASISKIEGLEVGAKTGTSESGENFHGWFVGYFKYKEKYYTLGVFVPNIGEENSKGEKTGGGNTAGPIFKDIILEFIKK
ncbi:penicillin-binding transpeptidase domain-containing protein [Clostridium tarantellae]|uniref:Stage V sporulation protein D n=1 Tax=Clostridium tarantellae TaxID=39493 RepID=A0A6I1MJH9_9CLOT|nr:penicillin-binding transpeptidase domain-containing protein [Clostridium tarantellae]MPQ43094.1 stage V sporulation protein D [Clostridium tarantellae]